MRAGIYARVSTVEQEPDNQLHDLRRYVTARGWDATEYVDQGVSGAKDSRPALNRLLADARRRKLDVVLCWRLDRLGRSLKHLISVLEELHSVGVAFVSLAEGIDATTPAGRLQMHILGAIAEFERARIVERVRAGLERAKRQGRRLGRPRRRVTEAELREVEDLSLRAAAQRLGVSRSVLHRARLSRKPFDLSPRFGPDSGLI